MDLGMWNVVVCKDGTTGKTFSPECLETCEKNTSSLGVTSGT